MRRAVRSLLVALGAGAAEAEPAGAGGAETGGNGGALGAHRASSTLAAAASGRTAQDTDTDGSPDTYDEDEDPEADAFVRHDDDGEGGVGAANNAARPAREDQWEAGERKAVPVKNEGEEPRTPPPRPPSLHQKLIRQNLRRGGQRDDGKEDDDGGGGNKNVEVRDNSQHEYKIDDDEQTAEQSPGRAAPAPPPTPTPAPSRSSRYALRPRPSPRLEARASRAPDGDDCALALALAPAVAPAAAAAAAAAADPRLKDVEEASVRSLRAICAELGLPRDGTKQELRARALAAVEQQVLPWDSAPRPRKPPRRFAGEVVQDIMPATTNTAASARHRRRRRPRRHQPTDSGSGADDGRVAVRTGGHISAPRDDDVHRYQDDDNDNDEYSEYTASESVANSYQAAPADQPPATHHKKPPARLRSASRNPPTHSNNRSARTNATIDTNALDKMTPYDQGREGVVEGVTEPYEHSAVRLDGGMPYKGITSESIPHMPSQSAPLPAKMLAVPAAESNPALAGDADGGHGGRDAQSPMQEDTADHGISRMDGATAEPASTLPTASHFGRAGRECMPETEEFSLSRTLRTHAQLPVPIAAGPTESVDAQCAHSPEQAYKNGREDAISRATDLARVQSVEQMAAPGPFVANLDTRSGEAQLPLSTDRPFFDSPAVGQTRGPPPTSCMHLPNHGTVELSAGDEQRRNSATDVPSGRHPTGIAKLPWATNREQPDPVDPTTSAQLQLTRNAVVPDLEAADADKPMGSELEPSREEGIAEYDHYSRRPHPPPPPTPSDPTVANILNEQVLGTRFQNEVVASLNNRLRKRAHTVLESARISDGWRRDGVDDSGGGRPPTYVAAYRSKYQDGKVAGLRVEDGANLVAERDAASERKRPLSREAATTPDAMPPPSKRACLVAGDQFVWPETPGTGQDSLSGTRSTRDRRPGKCDRNEHIPGQRSDSGRSNLDNLKRADSADSPSADVVRPAEAQERSSDGITSRVADRTLHGSAEAVVDETKCPIGASTHGSRGDDLSPMPTPPKFGPPAGSIPGQAAQVFAKSGAVEADRDRRGHRMPTASSNAQFETPKASNDRALESRDDALAVQTGRTAGAPLMRSRNDGACPWNRPPDFGKSPRAHEFCAEVSGEQKAAETPVVRPDPVRPGFSGFVTPQDLVRTLQNRASRGPSRALGRGIRPATNRQAQDAIEGTVEDDKPFSGSAFGIPRARYLATKYSQRRRALVSQSLHPGIAPNTRSLGSVEHQGEMELPPRASSLVSLQLRSASSGAGGMVTDLRSADTRRGADFAGERTAVRSYGCRVGSHDENRAEGFHAFGGALGSDRAAAMSSSARRILETLDKVTQENRAKVVKRDRSPLGPPPKGKRRRVQVDNGYDAGGLAVGGTDWFVNTIERHAAAAAAQSKEHEKAVLIKAGTCEKDSSGDAFNYAGTSTEPSLNRSSGGLKPSETLDESLKVRRTVGSSFVPFARSHGIMRKKRQGQDNGLTEKIGIARFPDLGPLPDNSQDLSVGGGDGAESTGEVGKERRETEGSGDMDRPLPPFSEPSSRSRIAPSLVPLSSSGDACASGYTSITNGGGVPDSSRLMKSDKEERCTGSEEPVKVEPEGIVAKGRNADPDESRIAGAEENRFNGASFSVGGFDGSISPGTSGAAAGDGFGSRRNGETKADSTAGNYEPSAKRHPSSQPDGVLDGDKAGASRPKFQAEEEDETHEPTGQKRRKSDENDISAWSTPMAATASVPDTQNGDLARSKNNFAFGLSSSSGIGETPGHGLNCVSAPDPVDTEAGSRRSPVVIGYGAEVQKPDFRPAGQPDFHFNVPAARTTVRDVGEEERQGPFGAMPSRATEDVPGFTSGYSFSGVAASAPGKSDAATDNTVPSRPDVIEQVAHEAAESQRDSGESADGATGKLIFSHPASGVVFGEADANSKREYSPNPVSHQFLPSTLAKSEARALPLAASEAERQENVTASDSIVFSTGGPLLRVPETSTQQAASHPETLPGVLTNKPDEARTLQDNDVPQASVFSRLKGLPPSGRNDASEAPMQSVSNSLMESTVRRPGESLSGSAESKSDPEVPSAPFPWTLSSPMPPSSSGPLSHKSAPNGGIERLAEASTAGNISPDFGVAPQTAPIAHPFQPNAAGDGLAGANDNSSQPFVSSAAFAPAISPTMNYAAGSGASAAGSGTAAALFAFGGSGQNVAASSAEVAPVSLFGNVTGTQFSAPLFNTASAFGGQAPIAAPANPFASSSGPFAASLPPPPTAEQSAAPKLFTFGAVSSTSQPASSPAPGIGQADSMPALQSSFPGAGVIQQPTFGSAATGTAASMFGGTFGASPRTPSLGIFGNAPTFPSPVGAFGSTPLVSAPGLFGGATNTTSVGASGLRSPAPFGSAALTTPPVASLPFGSLAQSQPAMQFGQPGGAAFGAPAASTFGAPTPLPVGTDAEKPGFSMGSSAAPARRRVLRGKRSIR